MTDDLGTDARGRFQRRATRFRLPLQGEGVDPLVSGVRAGRYRLYVSHACGWSHRTLLFRRLCGLESAVPLTRVEPFMGDQGWELEDAGEPELGSRYLRDLYLHSDPGYSGRASVPVLWDRAERRIASNESLDVIRLFDRAVEGGFRFFPPGLEAEIEEMIGHNYQTLNDGVYRAGFARSQSAHEEAVRRVFARLDALEERLARRRFLLGAELTAADLCLFPTLYRFDAVYHFHFKCNLQRLVDYPRLWAYARDVYQWPGVEATCDMNQIKVHYYRSHESINPRRLVPLGPRLDFEEPHDRAELS